MVIIGVKGIAVVERLSVSVTVINNVCQCLVVFCALCWGTITAVVHKARAVFHVQNIEQARLVLHLRHFAILLVVGVLLTVWIVDSVLLQIRLLVAARIVIVGFPFE